MDYDETDMTEEEFDARWSAGRPAKIARSAPRDTNQRAAGIVRQATETPTEVIVVRGNRFVPDKVKPLSLSST
jgi:hypothetical protein